MKWLEREQYSLLREKQTKTNFRKFNPGISKKAGFRIFLCKNEKFCGTLATMECEAYENEYFIETISTLLWKI